MERFLIDQVDTKCGAVLARLFSVSVIRELARKGYSPLAAEILDEAGLLKNMDPKMHLRDFFDQLFDILFRSYRNEYIYKNAIANKILLGRHSLNSSFMLTEFRVGNCKADTIILNGTSSVYEIKSAFDNMDRLKRQISSYSLIFDHIHVITSDEQLQKVSEEIDDSIGLMVLSNRHTISTVRNSRSMKHQVRPAAIFDSLRRAEYTQIIRAEYGFVPDVPNTQMYRECKELFCRLSPGDAHDGMVSVLRQRGNCRSLRDFIINMPSSLKAISLSCKLSHKEKAVFLNLLNVDVGDCIPAF